MSSDPLKAAGVPGDDAIDIDVSSMQKKGMNMDAGEEHVPWHSHASGQHGECCCGQTHAQLKVQASLQFPI